MTAAKQTTDGGDPSGYVTGYTYTLAGAIDTEYYPSGRMVKNVLDASGDLSQVKSARCGSTHGVSASCTDQQGFWSYAKNFTYNAAGAVTSMQLGNGRWESTVFNSRLQPTQIALGTVQNGYDKLKLNYTYNTTGNADNNGNVQSQTITVPTVGANTGFVAVQNYHYDSLNRLKDATENVTPNGGLASQSWKQAFTFDRYGNRNFDEANTTTLPKNCGTSPNFVVCTADRNIYNPGINGDGKNRLNASNGYGFDNARNTADDAQGRTFVYDAENKQISVSDPNGTIGQYFYDGDGKRVKKYVPSTGEVTIFVYDAAGKEIAEYSTIVAASQDAKVNYLTADHLGSPRINTDQNGNIIARHDYMPFGEEIATSQRISGLGYSDDTVRKQFTGYERDTESGLDFAKARNYRVTSARFLSPDPLQSSARNALPQSWNRYTYVLNNPLILTDPNGLKWGYYMSGNKRYFQWFDGNVGKSRGHEFKEWTGSDILEFKGLGTIRLGDDGRIYSVVQSTKGITAPASALANPQVTALKNAVTQNPLYRASEKALNPDGVTVSFQTPGVNVGGSLTVTKQFDVIWAPSAGRDFTSFSTLAKARSFGDVLNGKTFAGGLSFNATWITEMDLDRNKTAGFFTGPSVSAGGCYWVCAGATVVPGRETRYGLSLGVTPARLSSGISYSAGYYVTNLHGEDPLDSPE